MTLLESVRKPMILADFDLEITTESYHERYRDNVRQITLACIPQHS